MEPGRMHIASVDPDVSGLSHGETAYAPVPGTTRVFEVPVEVGDHLVRFGHWRLPEANDYLTEADRAAQILRDAAGHPDSVLGRRSGHRPMDPAERAELKEQLREEVLAELRRAGLLPTAPEPEPEAVTADAGEPDEDPDEDEPPARPARPAGVKKSARPVRRS